MPCSRHFRTCALALAALALLGNGGCSREQPRSAAQAAGEEQEPLGRSAFNRRAVELFLPLFWREDLNANGTIDPEELAVLTGYPRSQRSIWIDDEGAFTAEFTAALERMRQPEAPIPDKAQALRHRLVLEELAQGRPTLIETDLTQATPAEKQMVERMLRIAEVIERLYARQKGVFGMQARIPEEDTASRALFHRNQSPWCEAPKTENEPACSALPVRPPHIVGLYPASIQSNPQFCAELARAPNGEQLMDHFSIVAGEGPGSWRSVPYTQAYREDMEIVAQELEAAAAVLGEEDAALRHYLLAAAGSFRSNDWVPANLAWVAMNAHNSRWYVRIAPDEVYYDPCAWKAGFALQLALINPESIQWQEKLEPLKQDMERTLAAMAKAPYHARDVNFRIPDFVDVVLNAGDQRNAHGATIGQSLPNWGPVARQGGRTVAMTNLYTDADSRAQQGEQMAALFCRRTNALATTTPRETLISSVLHEAAHNLGPSHEYKVDGREDDVVFGGTLAATLEELKAQTSSMFLTGWLAQRGLFTQAQVDRIQLRNIAWGFGHISRGMYAADGTPRNYSQLAAIQLGAFMASGAIAWNANERAANGADQGCIQIDFEALPHAIEQLETTVLEIKASGDKARAEHLKARFVDAQNDFSNVKAAIAERWLRAPKASFVYSIRW